MSEFEDNVLNDAIEWHLKYYEKSLLDFNETNMRIMRALLINSKEHMKSFMKSYWESYLGNCASEC